MGRYGRLYLIALARCLMRDMAFRAHFLMRFVSDAVFLGVYFLFFTVVYTKVESIAGWTKPEVLLLIGTFHIINSLFLSLFFPNLLALPGHIRRGTLDGLLLRPIETQFLASVNDADLGSLANAGLGLALVLYAHADLALTASARNIIVYAALVVAGVMMLYGLFMILVCLAFWLSEVSWTIDLYLAFGSFADKPASIYRGLIGRILVYLVPLAVVANAPASAVLGRLSPELALLSLSMAAGLMVLARLVWQAGLRRYEGSSA